MVQPPQSDDAMPVRMAGTARAIDQLLDPDLPFVNAAPAEKRAALAQLGDGDLNRWLLTFNALLRDRDPATHTLDGESVATMFMNFPSQRDKPRLLSATAATIRAIAADPTLSDAVALRRIALTAAGAINLIHAFGNGNGRTARFLSYAIDQPVSNDTACRDALARVALDQTNWSTSPVGVHQMDGQVRRAFVAELPEHPFPVPRGTDAVFTGEYTGAEFEAACGLAPTTAAQVALAMNEDTIASTVLFATLLRASRMQPDLLVEDHGRTRIRTFAAIQALGAEGVETFLQTWSDLHASRVEVFLEEMHRPTLRFEFAHRGLPTKSTGTIPEAYETQLQEYSALALDGGGPTRS